MSSYTANFFIRYRNLMRSTTMENSYIYTMPTTAPPRPILHFTQYACFPQPLINPSSTTAPYRPNFPLSHLLSSYNTRHVRFHEFSITIIREAIYTHPRAFFLPRVRRHLRLTNISSLHTRGKTITADVKRHRERQSRGVGMHACMYVDMRVSSLDIHIHIYQPARLRRRRWQRCRWGVRPARGCYYCARLHALYRLSSLASRLNPTGASLSLSPLAYYNTET